MAKNSVLIATDGSPSAQLAVEVGLRLAHESGNPVVFVHVSLEITEELFAENPMTHPSSEHIAESDRILSQALQKASEYGVEAEVEVIGAHGARAIADVIVGTASGLDARMIVLGTRGRGGLTETVLGSVSHDVAATSDVPVVIVHAPEGTK